MDFFRGVEEMALAIRQHRRCLLPPDFVLHVVELTLAMSDAGTRGTTQMLKTSFEPISPMQSSRDSAIDYGKEKPGIFAGSIERFMTRLHQH